jgi:hypothetical protein
MGCCTLCAVLPAAKASNKPARPCQVPEAPPGHADWGLNVPTQAVKQLLLMLEVPPGDTAPRGDEAQRILAFFLSSLKNPQLQRPPPVHAMLSFGTLTPHCE